MTRRRSHFWPYYFLVAGVLLQGLSPVFTKLLLSDLSNATVVAARYLLAAIFLFPFGFHHNVRRTSEDKPEFRDWIALFMVGALGSGLAALLFTAALAYSHAGIANAISKTAPIFVAFFAYFALREKITWGRFSLVVLMVAAVILIGFGELSLGQSVARQYLLGDGLALGAGILRAISEILGKGTLRKFKPSTVAMWRFGVGFLVTGVVSLSMGQSGELLRLDVGGWTLLLVLAGVSTSLSMWLYYRGLVDIPAHVAVTLKLLGAIVTAVVSWIWLKEALNAYHIAGIAVLVFGAYLIVIRTARQQADEVPDEFVSETHSSHPWANSLKNKITALVSAAIIVTMLSGTCLAIRHTNSVINDQVRFAMGEMAYMILQYQTLGSPPTVDNYQQLLVRLVHHKIQSRIYSVDVLYVVLLDGHGRVIAHAADPEIYRLTAEGRQASPNYEILGDQLEQLIGDAAMKSSQDVIPLSAELEGYSQALKMGCRKSIARRAASEITVRYMTLAVLLIILGILVTSYLLKHITQPLERLSVAAGRIAAGDLSVPLVSGGKDEVRRLSDSMARMVAELQMAAMLRKRVFAAEAERGPTAKGHRPLPPVALVFDLTRCGDLDGGMDAATGVFLQNVLGVVSEYDGEIWDYGEGRLVIGWGVGELERDDVLRASLAGLAVTELGDVPSELADALMLITYMADESSAELLSEAEVLHRAGDVGLALYATATAYVEVGEYLEGKATNGFYRIVRLRNGEAIEQIAQSPDD